LGKSGGQIFFGIYGANSQEDYGTTNNEQNKYQEHQYSNPFTTKYFPQLI